MAGPEPLDGSEDVRAATAAVDCGVAAGSDAAAAAARDHQWDGEELHPAARVAVRGQGRAHSALPGGLCQAHRVPGRTSGVQRTGWWWILGGCIRVVLTWVCPSQGQFNGEAFIQMDSEAAAYQSAQQKHHKNMMFGKKQRYIEVFQCSGDDMNMVLNGGFQQPNNISKPPLLSPGMLQSAQQPQTQNPQTLALSQQLLSVPPPLTLSIPPPNAQLLAQQQAHFIAQQSLMARQAAAAAAANQQQEHLLLQHLSVYSTGASSVQSQAPPTYATANAVSPQSAASSLHMTTGHPPPSMSGMTQAGGIPAHLAGHPGAAAGQYPQFVFMPRHMVNSAGYPMGFMPSHFASPMHFPGSASGSAATAAGSLAQSQHHAAMLHHQSAMGHSQHHQQHAAAMNAAAAAAAAQSAQSAMLPASIKRSYDNAFRGDQSQLSAATTGSKRPFHGGQQAAAAAAAAALYAPYYHPHM